MLLGKWHPQTDSQHWETYVKHKTGHLIRQQEADDKIRYTPYKPHPTIQHITYTNSRAKEVEKPSTMHRISMHSESTQSWVFKKPGNSNIQQGMPNSPTFLINQEEVATRPQRNVTPTQGIPSTKINLQILQRIQGPVQENGSRQHLAAALKKESYWRRQTAQRRIEK